ncbi:hypothetical protein ABE096_07725 [Robertmurraya massiliosenegalensis]|uniref:hypothetical protein n=1 Tax=Robertmurraya massiliosenegalensis TaxID=1287657 RepID=UPI003D2DCD40
MKKMHVEIDLVALFIALHLHYPIFRKRFQCIRGTMDYRSFFGNLPVCWEISQRYFSTDESGEMSN